MEKYAALEPVLDERSRRLWAAAESILIGYDGDAVVSATTGGAYPDQPFAQGGGK